MTAGLQGVVPSTYVRLLFDYLTARGLYAEKLLGETAPAPDRGLGRYPVTRWRELLTTASTALDDPLLGLHLGQTITPAHFGVMGYVFLACGTLGAALQRLEQYQRLIYDVNPLHYSTTAGEVTLTWGTDHGKPGRLVDETAITALIQLTRDMTSLHAAPSRVAFVNAAPTQLGPYQDYFGCPVIFDSTQTQVSFPLAYLQQPLRQPDAALLAVLEQQANTLLGELPDADDFVQSVRRCLVRLIRQGEPALERVADELHLSPRTLHRRLEQSGQSFRRLLEDTRIRLAQEYLSDPRLQLAEIAQLLGYSEQSAFTRAFTRSLGQSPSQFRRQR